MTTSIDTNVLLSLWDRDPSSAETARIVLLHASSLGRLVICAPVYAELYGDPSRDELTLARFLGATNIEVEWLIDKLVWQESANAYRGYIQRRRKSGSAFPRRILTDFIIGAHALVNGYTLLTFDTRLYRAAFPKLKLQSNSL